MIPLDNVDYLLNKSIVNKPLQPYSDKVIKFLDNFSEELSKHPSSKLYPDILTLSFWCRKAHILQLKNKFDFSDRIGWGVVFHITPSNVPINFFFSYIFALLGGNSSIVRIPTKDFPQVSIIIDVLKKLFKKHKTISKMSCFVRYEKDDNINIYFSNIAQARIIWGGDKTINSIKRLPIKPKLQDIIFADRYSFSIIDTFSLKSLSEKEVLNLAKKFYNDTYLMDQNGCSSPHLILWKNRDTNQTKRFYLALQEVVKKEYELEYIKCMDKFTKSCLDSIYLNNIEIERYDNDVYVVTLKDIDKSIYKLRGQSGYFYEYFINELDEIKDIVNERFQSITYFGIDKKDIKDFILKNNLLGIDRIIPIGMAFEMDIIWDGYDIVSMLSRKIKVI